MFVGCWILAGFIGAITNSIGPSGERRWIDGRAIDHMREQEEKQREARRKDPRSDFEIAMEKKLRELDPKRETFSSRAEFEDHFEKKLKELSEEE